MVCGHMKNTLYTDQRNIKEHFKDKDLDINNHY